MVRIFDLRQKEVINSCDCKRLGFVGDVEFDINTGCIQAIIVPGPAQCWGIFGRDNEYVIPFDRICRIGPDIILVDINEQKSLVKCL
jgi:YlmC/YmxH family sporulation protein